MMRLLVILALALVVMTACDNSTGSKDDGVRFALADSAFVYTDSLLVELILGVDVHPTHAAFYLDDELVFTDMLEPYAWMWPVCESELGQHKISATVYTTEGGLINVAPWSPRHTPMPFYGFFLKDWGGVTERDNDGNLIGDVDPRDWLLHSFGGGSAREAWVSNFWVTSYDRVVTVRWNTTYESGNAGFHVWRGENAGAWDEGNAIRLTGDTMVHGAGNSQSLLEYAWVDTFRIEFTDYWYWLQSCDSEGETELFGPVQHSVEPWNPNLLDQLYPAWPNPAVNHTNLGVELRRSGLNLTVVAVNQQGDVLDLLMQNEQLNYGRHAIFWDSSAYTQQQLRVIYYFVNTETDSTFWGYGDVYVQ